MKIGMTRQHAIIIGLTLAAGLRANSYASDTSYTSADTTAGKAEPRWVLQITPYTWASSFKGNVSPFKRAPTIAMEKSFADIMDDLNFGGFIDIWARHESFVFSSDFMYVNTSDSRNIRALPVIGSARSMTASVDTEQLTASLKGGYRVYGSPDFTLDVLAGVRLWRVSNDITIRYASHSTRYGERLDWVDPLIGMRAFYGVTPALSIQAQADVGGWGIGSKRTWQTLATANYAFSPHLSVSVGYKVLSVDYRSGGYVFDATLKGPVAGLTYRF